MLCAFLGLASCIGDKIEVAPVSDTDLVDFCIISDGREYRPVDVSGTDLSIFVPAGTDLTKLVATYKSNAVSVTVGGIAQQSGVTANNFLNYKTGVVYKLVADDGKQKSYTVRVLDTKLPVVSVTNVGHARITDRENWKEASLKILNPDGSTDDLGSTGIRGRGNWTWEKYPKKPYALKLDERQPVLGMPAHKRWVLLALYRGFIGNALMFEATRRAPAMKWAPRGQFVEFVLNGKYQGLYYLCEQIKIDKDRVDIAELAPEDVNYPEVSGGYLLEYDQLYDEEYKFMSYGFNLPVQLKAPNTDVPDEQFNYIRNYINEMEAEILKIGKSGGSRYGDYLDIDSFADYWLVLETICNYEAYKPRSVKMYKGRDGVDSPKGTVSKLMAGPLWDQEWFLVDREFNSKNMYYFKYLFRDPEFVNTVKTRWETYKSNILGNDTYIPFLEYLNQIVATIEISANRDISYWDNGYFTLSSEVTPVRNGFLKKINWMDTQILGL